MALTWPSILPQRSLEDSFRAAMPDGRLRLQNEGGPGPMRRRSTAAPQPIVIDMLMQQYQMARLDRFWRETTKCGCLPFFMPDTFNDAYNGNDIILVDENSVPLLDENGVQLLIDGRRPLVAFGADEIAWAGLAADVWRATFSLIVLRDA